jgi:hypothetical protein
MSRDEHSISDGVDASASQDAEVARVLDLYLAEPDAGRAADPGRLPKSDTARVEVQDQDNSLGRDGSVIEKTGPSTWVLHLDDAGSAEIDHNDADVLIEIRLVPAGPALPK